MKHKIKLSFLLLFAFGAVAFAQKKNENGKIYDQHPGIDLMKKFTEAYVIGDRVTLSTLLTDDFVAYNALGTNKDDKGKDREALINESVYWSSQLKGFKITKRGKSYPDALEYKESGTWIDTYDVFYGIDKETGFKIETPMDRSFILSNDGTQIRILLSRFNTATFGKYMNTFKVVENGTIYRDHPYINTVRKMVSSLELGDLNLCYEQFTEEAKFSDINAPRGVTHSKAEERKQVTDLLNVYDIVSLDEWGYPDYLAYNGDGSTVLSWWVFRFVKKDTGEKVELFMHLSHNFNNDGKITNQVAYYNGNLLK